MSHHWGPHWNHRPVSHWHRGPAGTPTPAAPAKILISPMHFNKGRSSGGNPQQRRRGHTDAPYMRENRPRTLPPPQQVVNHFLQVGGTAMGTRVASTLANMFMGDFERKHIYTYRLQPRIWVRFIDDIFLLWTHGQMELDLFIQHLNRAHQNITFTSEISETQVPFLDTLVIKSGASLRTDLYTKPTDANNLLHYDSAHPPHCKKGIPFGQFLRIRRICSRKQDFDRHGLVKAAPFIARGYPPRLVVQAFLKARNLDIDSTPQPDDHRSETVPNILVTTFHPSFNNLSQILRNNWDILSHSSKTREIHSSRLITTLRKPPNLRSFASSKKIQNLQSFPQWARSIRVICDNSWSPYSHRKHTCELHPLKCTSVITLTSPICIDA